MSAFVLIPSGKHPDFYELETRPWGTISKRCWVDEDHIMHQTEGKVRLFDTGGVYSVERCPAKTAVRGWKMKPRPQYFPAPTLTDERFSDFVDMYYEHHLYMHDEWDCESIDFNQFVAIYGVEI